MPHEHILSLSVNGEPVRRLVPSHRSLLELLRDDLDLTGTKHGCDVGDCGACTVLVDGVARLSCITLAVEMEGREVGTIEGVAKGDRLHPVQTAFDKHVASQCGYCTPGIVLALIALLEEDPHPDDDTIRQTLGSNICRCTGYTKILAAAREAAGRGSPSSEPAQAEGGAE
ncbi:MAG: (2Fe-2S)-binding protein [Pseudomonadota bacterium]|nr:(2Fe-2S)-binding protein [Pseudomonadota bacterium]